VYSYGGIDLGTLIAFWIIGTIVVALIARSRQLPAAGYVVLSLILSPLIGAVVVLLAKGGDRAPCWQCKELVIRGATKCPHCGAELTWPDQAPATRS
jgi:hypothetical protein